MTSMGDVFASLVKMSQETGMSIEQLAAASVEYAQNEVWVCFMVCSSPRGIGLAVHSQSGEDSEAVSVILFA